MRWCASLLIFPPGCLPVLSCLALSYFSFFFVFVMFLGKGELAERARVVAEWTTGTADPTELCKNAMDFFLWKGCLQVLQCCDRDEPALARKLIR